MIHLILFWSFFKIGLFTFGGGYAMFPLVEPVLDSLSSQIYSGQSLDDLEYSSDQKYTALMLIHAIDEAVTKAEAD